MYKSKVVVSRPHNNVVTEKQVGQQVQHSRASTQQSSGLKGTGSSMEASGGINGEQIKLGEEKHPGRPVLGAGSVIRRSKRRGEGDTSEEEVAHCHIRNCNYYGTKKEIESETR